ncbi:MULTISPECIES: NAD(P)-dependent oxidoreductase [unclassified Roseitalea]|uniref:NAD-dependent epimerase/dehydratase family protein n=1 Tax=unclassified Roseitalea TaxID=2639107 RepID=UPI00273E2DB5|nr:MULTISPECIES: NAD(P)-dependent oxidoreductase [unclassified Roseitalea]
MSAGRVLITGAAGFVGSALATGFLASRWQVAAVDRAFDASARTRLSGADRIRADLGADPAPALPSADVIIHAAALTTDPAEAGITCADHLGANLAPLLAILRHAARSAPSAFVFLSSSGVFEPGDGDPDLTDACTPTARTPYAAAKRAGELLAPAALAGVCDVHVVRLGHLYGPHEMPRASRMGLSRVARYRADAAAGRPLIPAAGDPRREWTHVDDLAPALTRLLAGPPRAGAVHLCAPAVLRDSELAAIVAAAVPGTRIAPAPESGPPAKPPMIASRLAALDGLAWTAPRDGIAALCRQKVPA